MPYHMSLPTSNTLYVPYSCSGSRSVHVNIQSQVLSQAHGKWKIALLNDEDGKRRRKGNDS